MIWVYDVVLQKKKKKKKSLSMYEDGGGSCTYCQELDTLERTKVE